MATPEGPRWTRPWTPIGIGWLLAVAVVFIVGGGLLHLWALGEQLIAICLLLLALALLL